MPLISAPFFFNLLLDQGEVDSNGPSLTDVMVFLTGCDTIPPSGYADCIPSISFLEDGKFPTLSTCSLCVRFPMGMRCEQNAFKEFMDFAILESEGFFGQV